MALAPRSERAPVAPATPTRLPRCSMAASEMCIRDSWNADRTRKWEGLKPSPGDRIYMQRYSGQLVLGRDGKIYRLCEQNCIGAIEIREAAPYVVTQQYDPDVEFKVSAK